jgi:uncharacterized protein (TIGR03032 family)
MSEPNSEKGEAGPKADTDSPLRSVHTTSFPPIARSFGALAVTTYQAGKLVFLRPERQETDWVLNTHFRNARKPMGLAWEPGRMALGTATEVWEYHDMPAVAAKLNTADSPRKHDACFLPRTAHITGDVQVHEMVWLPPPIKPRASHPSASPPDAADFSELWFVNTRFSCLATRSNIFSFIPRWRPPFIDGLAPEDRCHLNGLALRDGKVRYVTALGATNKPGGWRENKRSGGVLIDVTTDQTLCSGLSMPHSPRWHDEKLWLLESGNGGVGLVDEKTGKYTEIIRLPGFTRGIDFAGPYAFVGLSQVRETAVFSGIAIAEMKQEDRCCGVWVIDTRTAKIAGFVKFTQGVQEIFAVQVLTGLQWPEVLNEGERLAESFELPDHALRQVPAAMREPSRKRGGADPAK